MVGAAAGGLGGAALRTTMVVGARIGAIRQFGLLSRTMGVVNNRMVQTSLGVANLVGTMSLLGGVMNALVNPFTGLFALLATAMAAKNEADYAEGVRSVQLAWGMLGDQAGDIKEFFKDVEHYTSQDQATSLLNNADAVKKLAEMYGDGDEGMATEILKLATELAKVKDVEFGTVVDTMAEAANGSMPALKELARITGLGTDESGGLASNANSAQKMFGLLKDTLDQTDFDHTGPEKLSRDVGLLAERLAPIPNFFTNLSATIAAGIVRAMSSIVDSVFDIVSSAWGVGGALWEIISTLWGGIGKLIWMTLTGEFSEIPNWIKTEWIPSMLGVMERWGGNLTLMAEGFGLDWFMGLFFGSDDFWEANWEDRGEMIVRGLIRGMSRMFDDMKRAVSELVDAFNQGIGPGFKQIWNWIVAGMELTDLAPEGSLPTFEQVWRADIRATNRSGLGSNIEENIEGYTGNNPTILVDSTHVVEKMRIIHQQNSGDYLLDVGVVR